MSNQHNFEVIVVGGGHAGTEAALSAARMGVRTLLLTHNIETIGQMSCNPAIGGIGKGHLVKEIDALGGIMALAADQAGIQFRILNASKGPAVRATRAQADRLLYKQAIRLTVENQPNLVIFQQAVDDLIVTGEKVQGVITQMGLNYFAPVVILTTGTFLGGKIHIGLNNYRGGRAGDPPALALADRLRELPLRVGRLKTGTPPRLDGRTINYAELTPQPGDDPLPVFSFWGSKELHPQQMVCHITHTNNRTHEIIAKNLDRSPMYSDEGEINSRGPRYCPSIEDKIHRFSERNSHQIFIEPEGLTTHEVYPNGVSTSLPFDVQQEFIHSIKGFENVHITRPGYAIEYDFFDPRDLYPTLETKCIKGLFFAGQINGTTGYEEAAAQGLIAGINAALQIQQKDSWYPTRDLAYLGVLIDDLLTQGAPEPYRMFTSRAEYRLSLREDNADLRLTEIGYQLGLINETQWAKFNSKRELIEKENTRLKSTWVRPQTEIGQAIESFLNQPLAHEYSLMDLLRRPGISYKDLMSFSALQSQEQVIHEIAEQIEIQAKYAGYIERQSVEVLRLQNHEQTKLPDNINYLTVRGLSNEVREKLVTARPSTIGQASRIPGVTPAAISLLLVHLKSKHE